MNTEKLKDYLAVIVIGIVVNLILYMLFFTSLGKLILLAILVGIILLSVLHIVAVSYDRIKDKLL